MGGKQRREKGREGAGSLRKFQDPSLIMHVSIYLQTVRAEIQLNK